MDSAERETINILSDPDTMDAIREGEQDWRVEYDAQGPYVFDQDAFNHRQLVALRLRYTLAMVLIVIVVPCLTALGVRWGW